MQGKVNHVDYVMREPRSALQAPVAYIGHRCCRLGDDTLLFSTPTMSLQMFSELYENMDPTLKYPVNFCIATTATVYVLSVITGNVSQVDRVWTFLPFIYTAYFALMPLWPDHPKLFLSPYTPKDVPYFVKDEYSPRALLMLGLVVSQAHHGHEFLC